MGALASSKNGNDIMTLLEGYQICAATEGKSGKTIEIVTRSVTYFTRFLTGHDPQRHLFHPLSHRSRD